MEGSSIWSTIQSTVAGKAKSLIENHEEIVVGIDFGTSNSCVALWRKDKHRVKIVKNTKDERITPSAVHFYNNFENYHVGDLPKDSAVNQYCTIQGVKSLLGATKLENIPSYFTHPCSIEDKHDENDKQVIITAKDPLSGEEKQFTSEELIALIISYLRLSVFQYLKRKPIKNQKDPSLVGEYDLSRVVIGVPAHFPEKKREALRSAAIMGGFEEVHFMIESTAAAMAYGLLVAGEKIVLIFDMGGGTTDLTILDIKDGKYDIQYTYGQSRLGGKDIDSILVQKIIDIIISELLYWELIILKEDIMNHHNCLQRLYELCKDCKEQLTNQQEVTFKYFDLLTLLAQDNQHPAIQRLLLSLEEKKSMKNNTNKKRKGGDGGESSSPFEFTVSRKEFERWIAPILQTIEQTITHTLTQYQQILQTKQMKGGVKEDNVMLTIDEVVLVGGSSQIPSIQTALRKACGKMGIHSFAVRNEQQSNSSPMQATVTSTSSKETDKVAEDDEATTLTGKEFCVSINPNYAVAEGLAIRGAIIAGEDSSLLKDILMMDCLPMTLGVLLYDSEGEKYFEPIIYQGSKLPIEQRKRITISDVKQKYVTLEIYEEIEEIAGFAPTVSSAKKDSGSTHTDQGEGKIQEQRMKYSYYLLVTCDVLIEMPALLFDEESDGARKSTTKSTSRQVDVVFRVNEDGNLSYQVEEVIEDEVDSQASYSSNRKEPSSKSSDLSSRQMMLLVFYTCFLLVVYVAMKLLFPNITITNHNHIDEGGSNNVESE